MIDCSWDEDCDKLKMKKVMKGIMCPVKGFTWAIVIEIGVEYNSSKKPRQINRRCDEITEGELEEREGGRR